MKKGAENRAPFRLKFRDGTYGVKHDLAEGVRRWESWARSARPSWKAFDTSTLSRLASTRRATLRTLERDGLVRREVYPVIPPRVEYELRELGHNMA